MSSVGLWLREDRRVLRSHHNKAEKWWARCGLIGTHNWRPDKGAQLYEAQVGGNYLPALINDRLAASGELIVLERTLQSHTSTRSSQPCKCGRTDIGPDIDARKLQGAREQMVAQIRSDISRLEAIREDRKHGNAVFPRMKPATLVPKTAHDVCGRILTGGSTSSFVA